MSKNSYRMVAILIATALLSACNNQSAAATDVNWWPQNWFNSTLADTLSRECAGLPAGTSVPVNNAYVPCPSTPAGAPPYVAAPPEIVPTAAPAATQAPAAPAFTQQWEVPDGRWTPALTKNLVIELAVQIRPDRPWEGTVAPVEDQVYQFKTEYLDEDATTWQPGVHLYEYDLAAGWQPVFVGIQGDSPVQLCWMQEKGALGAQLLMKTMKGNGTSALVFFTKTDKVPEGICP